MTKDKLPHYAQPYTINPALEYLTTYIRIYVCLTINKRWRFVVRKQVLFHGVLIQTAVIFCVHCIIMSASL